MKVCLLFLTFLIFPFVTAGCGAKVDQVESPTIDEEKPVEQNEENQTSMAWVSEYGGKIDIPKFNEIEESMWSDLFRLVRCKRDDRLVTAASHHAKALMLSPDASHEDGEIEHLKFTLLKTGSFDYGIESAVITLDEESRAFLTNMVSTRGKDWTHCGIGVASEGTRSLAVWIGVKRTLEIDPFPVSVNSGSKQLLSVRSLDGKDGSVQLFVGLPDTTVIKPEPSLRKSGGRSSFEIPITQKGRYELELLHDTGHGFETVLLVPFFADVEPDAGPVVVRDPKNRENSDPEEELLSLLNASRKKVRLPAMIRDKRLDAVAKKHSLDMARNNFFGHTSPQFGGLAKRLEAAGLSPSRSGENIAGSTTPFRIHRNLMDSPAHRINILNPNYTHVGIGIVEKDGFLSATEIYALW